MSSGLACGRSLRRGDGCEPDQLTALTFLLLAAPTAFADALTGKVVKVADGDSIEQIYFLLPCWLSGSINSP